MTPMNKIYVAASLLVLGGQVPMAVTAGEVDASESRLIAAGQTLLERGDAERAIGFLRKGIGQTMDPDIRAAGHASLCAAYVEVESPKKAIRYCDKALRIDSENWQAYNDRGKAYLSMGRAEEAASDFGRALALQPDNEAIKENLALARAAIGRDSA